MFDFCFSSCTAWDWIFLAFLAFSFVALIYVFVRILFPGRRLTEGLVVGKYVEPERTWVQLIPLHIGKVLTFIPIRHFDDKDWVLVIEKEGKQQQVYVSQQVFEKTKKGQYYVVGVDDDTTDDIEETEDT